MNLIPVCLECGRCLVPHIRLDEKFIWNDRWYNVARRFDDFIEASRDTLYSDLRVGICMYDYITCRFLNVTARNTKSPRPAGASSASTQRTSSVERCISARTSGSAQVLDRKEPTIIIKNQNVAESQVP